jgi:tetratricopeptide (TPR) repeat protein
MRRLILIVLAIAVMVVWGVAYQRLILMDGVPLYLSRPGLQGLILYLRSDWGGAARAWRAAAQGRSPQYIDDPAGAYAVRAGDLPLAERRARTTLTLVPSALAPQLTLAEIALDRGRPAEAVELLEAVLKRYPDHVDALLLTAIARARKDDDRAAIAAISRALRHNRVGSRPTLFVRVLELAGDLAAPDRARRPLCLLAHVHRYLRIFDEAHGQIAIDWARQAIAARDRPADAYLVVGIALDKRGRHLDALQAFQQAIALDSRHAEALRWAGVQGFNVNDPVLRYRMARAALEAAPDDPHYLAPVDEIVTRWYGDHRATADLMQRVVKVDPGNAGAHDRLAAAAAAMGEAERAAIHSRRAAELRGRRRDL